MGSDQPPIESLDLSSLLHTIMAARNLTVSDMARMSGVSKSSMEKYLAGPSSPRAISIASLSRALGLSADTILFGVLDSKVELAYELAFRAFASLIEDLKDEAKLGTEFNGLTAGTEAFSEFVRNAAFERARRFKREFNAERREAHMTVIG